MPRLNLQIMHEWSTPANKKLAEVVDDDGNGIPKSCNRRSFSIAALKLLLLPILAKYEGNERIL
jgi:hypothetical protein